MGNFFFTIGYLFTVKLHTILNQSVNERCDYSTQQTKYNSHLMSMFRILPIPNPLEQYTYLLQISNLLLFVMYGMMIELGTNLFHYRLNT